MFINSNITWVPIHTLLVPYPVSLREVVCEFLFSMSVNVTFQNALISANIRIDLRNGSVVLGTLLVLFFVLLYTVSIPICFSILFKLLVIDLSFQIVYVISNNDVCKQNFARFELETSKCMK